jgi:hypothetical protein
MSAGLILDFSSSSSVVMPLVCSVVVVTIVVVTTWCDSDWLVSAISQLVCNKTGGVENSAGQGRAKIKHFGK